MGCSSCGGSKPKPRPKSQIVTKKISTQEPIEFIQGDTVIIVSPKK
jgi:hypothetical protein